jgi:hypothetical protein
MHQPSRVNAAAFERAVNEVAAAAGRLLEELEPGGPPRDRAVERDRARQRAARRFGEAPRTEGGRA